MDPTGNDLSHLCVVFLVTVTTDSLPSLVQLGSSRTEEGNREVLQGDLFNPGFSPGEGTFPLIPNGNLHRPRLA